jgi:hypothetical protein
VTFAPGGGLAYRPGELLVRSTVADAAFEVLNELRIEFDVADEELLGGAWTRLTEVRRPLEAIQRLRRFGVAAQVNNVLFATSCCPPHPADPGAEAFYASPRYANPMYANPMYANPMYANPMYANPAYPNAGCCCCEGSWAANPMYANPMYANPMYANAAPSPFGAPWTAATGPQRSSARPADAPAIELAEAEHEVRIAILDTGYAQAPNDPNVFPGINVNAVDDDIPDEDGDGYLDPVAGHGTFIAGVIEQITPGCQLEVFDVLSEYGEVDEAAIGQVLFDLALRPDEDRPEFVNLSLGGYSPLPMDALADAIAALLRVGTVVVASAGNDATCTPMYPAALPGVVGVGALERNGEAAVFTNYGPWVNACTLGVDVVSSFFDGFNGAEPLKDGNDPDDFHGWARWSGTSFAAPRVVAALAQEVINGQTPQDAVERLVGNIQLARRPMLGTIVLP